MSTASPQLLTAPAQTVPVGDCELGHRVVGDGPDLVFIHGWPLHGLTWRHVVEALADRYRCHVFDLPGTGASVWTTEQHYGIESHAQRVLAAIDALGIERFGLVGHDSGAAVGRYVAAAAGPRAWASVISGSEIPGHHPLLLRIMMKAGRLPGATEGFRTMLRSPRLRQSSLGWGACFDDPTRAEGEFHGLFGAPLIADDRAFLGQMGLVRDWDWAATDALTEVHGRIEGPSLLLWGEGDPYFPADLARAMVPSFAGGARFVSRPDARLFVHEEHPAWFADQVGSFLAAARAEAPSA